MTRLGILVGGGPAPGINCAISSATIEACNEGLQVVGIYDGFEHLMRGDPGPVMALDIRSVSRIHAEGGSILRTARANPTTDPALVERTVQTLRELGISLLVSIGGEDTASSAAAVARRSGGTIRVAHIPKTIDNDLPLPAGLPTFGYETARHVGTEQVLNLTEEARSTARWVIVVIMGRNAGHLALGIGKAAGATLTIIPEEFGDRMVTLDHISAIIEGSIFKRRRQDRPYGVAVVAEGVVSRMQPDEVDRHFAENVDYDPHGHLRLEELPLGMVLRRHLQTRLAERGHSVKLTDVTLGYTLRCAPPIPFDIDYTRTLGFGAVRFLLSPAASPALQDGALIAQIGGRISPIPFSDITDAATGRIRVRRIDIGSEHYDVARRYMIRLERSDLTDAEELAALACTAGMEPEAFARQYGPVAGSRGSG